MYTIATATVRTDTDISGVPLADETAGNEVTEGSIVKAIFIEVWLSGEFNLGSFVLMVEKSGQGNLNPSFTELTTLDAYQNKKNILFVSQGLLGEDNQNPTPVLRQWLKIPKGKQRFGLRDQIRINIAAIGAEAVKGCGFVVYKSYR